MHKAMFWKKAEEQRVQCILCPQKCLIAPERRGFCKVRVNEEGSLYSVNYGKCSSYGFDPIEKKPLYHFLPGSSIFSVGTFGCNFRCGFCQNWSIAHGDPDTVVVTPEKLVETAANNDEKSVGIAYTYSEPLMWYEFVYDTAKKVRAAGMKNVLVTNGFINPEPLKEILPLIDAMNIDVKGFSDSYYNEACVGELHPVLETVELASSHCHVEITTLLVTGLNDSRDEISQLVDWLAGVNPEIPLHFSRYFPNYQMELPPTPVSTMEMAREIALEKLSYVYLGNLRGTDASNTYCPQCKQLLIDRSGYRAALVGMKGDTCSKCGRKINIVVL